MAEKTVNYTPEQTAALISRYVDDKISTENLAIEFGKSVRSIVAKLTREKVYVKKEYKSKTGEPVVRKNELADAIGAVLNMTESEITGLAGAPKTALQKIFSALANSKPI